MKRFLYLLCALAFCLALTPSTALAAGTPATLWVGGTQITTSGYWTTDANGKLTTGNATNYNVHYDGNGTLTLNNATIQGRGNPSNTEPQDYGIYAAAAGGESVSLTINLTGKNTVKGYSGICVETPNGNGNSTLVIQSDGNNPENSLEASGSGWNGITVASYSGNASLTTNNASITADTEKQNSHGVSLKSQSDTELSLTVNGGSLTAQGTYGIFYSSFYGTTPSTSLTVSDNASVKAIPSIHASVASKPTPQGDGIVFDGTEGTVYGNVTLQNPLTIEQGETLTIPEGSTLDTNGKLTNDGTIINKGKLTGGTDGTGTIETAPIITTDSLPNGTVGTPYTVNLEATGDSIEWIATGLPAGLTLDANGTINGTPTANGRFPVNVIAKNSAGEASKEYKLTIEPATVPVTGVTLDQTELSLIVDGTAKLDATVEPDTATDKTVTWSSDNDDVATVDADGNVKAVAPGTATITVTTQDGSHTATCTVTVTAKTYTVSVTPSSIDFGSECPDYTQPAAQSVTITNTGNQTVEVTLPAATGYTITGSEGFTNGTASIEPKGTATFTVQPNSNLTAGTYDETLTVYGTTVTVRFTVGHEWGEPAWSWNGTKATATFTCAECGETQNVKATVTPTVTTDPTCTGNGTTTYTATATFNGTTYTATKNITIPATGHEWGEDGHCTICDAVKPGFTPEIIQGDKATWTKGDGQPLSFTSNAAYADFQEARVDGQTLDPVHYTVEQGSTIVTLKAAYLESLDPGGHTLDIVSSTGTATATFTITAKETQQPAKPADTDRTPAKSAGDGGQLGRGGSDIMPAVATLAILMAAGLVLGTFVLRRGRR